MVNSKIKSIKNKKNTIAYGELEKIQGINQSIHK